jgi:G:T-mismatch repair DNA endonuclease (very short patch repair protein)
MGLGFYTGVTTVYCGYCDKALIRRTSELKGSGHFCNRTCSTRYLNLQSYKNGPNKSEIYLGEMLRSYHFSFVGDGKFFLGARNPDFVNRRRRLVVELFGEHWHDQEDVNRVKRNHAQYGYQTLVIWFRHLKSTRLRNRIEKFVAGGEE